ncbi:unnamed protein product, partial [Polarella glacialis]
MHDQFTSCVSHPHTHPGVACVPECSVRVLHSPRLDASDVGSCRTSLCWAASGPENCRQRSGSAGRARAFLRGLTGEAPPFPSSGGDRRPREPEGVKGPRSQAADRYQRNETLVTATTKSPS